MTREQGGLTREDQNPVRPMNFFYLVRYFNVGKCSPRSKFYVNLLRESSKPVLISIVHLKRENLRALHALMTQSTRKTCKYAILLLASFAGTAACAPAHVSHRGQVMSLRSSQSSDSFSSDAVSYCNIAFNAPQSTAAPNRLAASLNSDGEADTRKKMQLRPHKLSRTVELY